MTELLDRLNREHRALAQVLDLFDDLLDGFHEGKEPDYELMCEMLEEDVATRIHRVMLAQFRVDSDVPAVAKRRAADEGG